MSEEVTVLRAPARATLGEIAERLRGPLEAAGAVRAIVFGSWARGEADGYSDLDLVVVIDTELPRFERASQLGAVLGAAGMPVDLLVFTPEEFERGVQRRLDVFDAIAREGVVIHERRKG
jgi:predicted nucleotidyltransferase